jgi:hypothetical protein
VLRFTLPGLPHFPALGCNNASKFFILVLKNIQEEYGSGHFMGFFFINVMRVKAVVVNLSSSNCSISCVCSELLLRSCNVRLSHSSLYVYALELNAVAY